MEPLLIAVVGVVAPALVQIVRRVTGSVSLNDLVAQAITLAVSFALAVLVDAADGGVQIDGDLVSYVTAVFGVATLVYKQFQAYFDELLPGKS